MDRHWHTRLVYIRATLHTENPNSFIRMKHGNVWPLCEALSTAVSQRIDTVGTMNTYARRWYNFRFSFHKGFLRTWREIDRERERERMEMHKNYLRCVDVGSVTPLPIKLAHVLCTGQWTWTLRSKSPLVLVQHQFACTR